MTNMLLAFIDLSGVNMSLWIVSQIFAALALVVIIYAMIFSKTKTKTLYAIIVFNILMIVSTALLKNWLPAGIYAVAIVRDFVFIWREKKHPINKNLAVATLVAFLIISTAVSCFTINWSLPSLQLALAVAIQLMALFVIYGAWAKGIHLMRISRFSLNVFYIFNYIIFQNYVALMVSTFTLISIIVFYVRFLEKKRAQDKANPENSENQSQQQGGTHGQEQVSNA